MEGCGPSHPKATRACRPEWHEVKEYLGQKSSFGISDLHRNLNLHVPPGRAASRGRFRSKGMSSQTRLNFGPFPADLHFFADPPGSNFPACFLAFLRLAGCTPPWSRPCGASRSHGCISEMCKPKECGQDAHAPLKRRLCTSEMRPVRTPTKENTLRSLPGLLISSQGGNGYDQ